MPKIIVWFALPGKEGLVYTTVSVPEPLEPLGVLDWINEQKEAGYLVDENDRVWLTETIVSAKMDSGI